MGTNWEVNENAPEKDEKYEWKLPENEAQHQQETVAPGDLRLKPKDVSLVPTNAPKQSGIQSGQAFWTVQSGVTSSGWYILGTILSD